MPPTPDEIEAAAGRLRRLAAGEHAAAVYAGMEHLGGAAFFATRDTGTLADAWLARPVTVPVGTPEEVAAARARVARVICDGESREVVFGTADWLPRARADNNLVGRHDAQQWRLKDPVYQQGYNDGLTAANPADDAVPINAGWLTSVAHEPPAGGHDYWQWVYGDGQGRLCVWPRYGLWWCSVEEAGADRDSQLPQLTTRGQLRRLLAALGVPATIPTNPTPEE